MVASAKRNEEDFSPVHSPHIDAPRGQYILIYVYPHVCIRIYVMYTNIQLFTISNAAEDGFCQKSLVFLSKNMFRT